MNRIKLTLAIAFLVALSTPVLAGLGNVDLPYYNFGVKTINGDAADIDNDGDLDFLTSQSYFSHLHFTRNDGSSLVNGYITNYANDGKFMDFDNDGWEDIVNIYNYGGVGTHGLQFRQNNQAGGFVHTSTLSTTDLGTSLNNLASIAVADYDNDGDDDLLLAGSRFNQNAIVLQNDGSGNFTEVYKYTWGNGQTNDAVEAQWADMDNDGNLDFMILIQSWDANNPLPMVWKNTGTTFQPAYTEPAPGVGLWSRDGQAVDLDGDGDMDIVAQGSLAGGVNAVVVFENTGNFNFTRSTVYDQTNMSQGGVRAADFDYDGDMDLVTTTGTAWDAVDPQRLLILENLGNLNFSPGFEGSSTTGTLATAISSISWVGDAEGDGDLEVLTGEYYSGYLWGFNSTPNSAPVANAGADQSVVTATATADVTLDGSGSYDADGDALTFTWSIAGTQIATGVTPMVTLPIGAHTIDLTVSDGTNSNTDQVVITVVGPYEQTFTIFGANGNPGDIDPYSQSLPAGATTWQPVYLTGWHPWGFIPNTNSWVNYDPDNTVGLFTRTPYRIRFMVPNDFSNPSLIFNLKADNRALIWINDTFIDSVDGEGSPAVDATIASQALHPGLNEIRLTMVDWGGIVGFNYRIDVTMTSAEDISGAVLTNDEAAAMNNPPVADAGPDQTSTTATVTLDGSGSSDPDGNLLIYSWSIGGTEIATGVNPTVNLADGTQAIVLTVSDGELSDTDTVHVTVDLNTPPIADAGADQSFGCAIDSVDATLDGSGSSDPDNDALSYAWSGDFGSVVGINPTVRLGGGTHVIILTVDDGNGATATDTMSVSVELDQIAPVITLTDGDSTDAIVGYAYSDPGATVADNCDANLSLSVDLSAVDTSHVGFYNVVYTATDTSGNTSSATRVVHMINHAPAVSAPMDSVTLSFGDADLSVTLDVSQIFSDPDSHPLTFTVTNSADSIAVTDFVSPNLTVSAVDLGGSIMTLTASDPYGGTVEYQIIVTVKVTPTLADAVVFGSNRATFNKETSVVSGNILVNNTASSHDEDDDDDDDHDDSGDGHHGNGHGDDDSGEDHSHYELTFQRDITVDAGYQVMANGIRIKSGTEISSDVYYNQIHNQGTITGDEYASVAIPLFSTLPPFKAASAGSQSVVVNQNDSETLDAGDYKDLIVKKHGSVTLTGGVYNFRKIVLKKDARLKVADYTDIRVERSVKADKQVYIGPADGALITASGIIFYVNGGGEEETFKLGEKSDIFASVWAQSGKVSIKKETNATGSFWGERVKIDKECNLTLDSYFGGSGSGLAKVMAWQEPAGRNVPNSFALHANYPNPFNPTTTLSYDLTRAGLVKLMIYDLLGREVATLVNHYQPAGTYSLRFDASGLSTGTYLVVLTSNGQRNVRKMTLLK